MWFGLYRKVSESHGGTAKDMTRLSETFFFLLKKTRGDRNKFCVFWPRLNIIRGEELKNSGVPAFWLSKETGRNPY